MSRHRRVIFITFDRFAGIEVALVCDEFHFNTKLETNN